MSARALLLATGSVVRDADAVAWAAQVVTNGGTVSALRLAVVSDFIAAEKSAGTWALTDDYWGLWGENELQALTSLKRLVLATAVAVPAFVANRGYTSNATTSYINTGFICSTHSTVMTGINLRLGVYVRTNVASANQIPAGALNASSQSIYVTPRGGTGAFMVSLNSQATGPGGVVITDSRGYSVGNRTNGSLAANIKGYKNGAEVVPYPPGTLGSALCTRSIFICCTDGAGGTPINFYTGQVSFVTVGASVSSAQEAAQYANVQAWATAVGANV